MRRTILSGFLALACAALVVPVAARADVLRLGARAPMAGVKMTGADGKVYTIASVARDKGTLVVFTCNSCPWAQAWEERIVELGNTWSKQGVGVIAINSNDPEVKPEDGLAGMKERAKERDMAFPYVVDATSDVARAFGATRTPEAFLFDAGGRLVYHGTIDDNAREPDKVKAHYLEDAIQAMTHKKKIELTETKAFGCTIKYREKSDT
jgi:hypothetical protein